MLSILIPTYNYDVKLLIESLIKQLDTSAFPFEIRIQDDCSTNSDALKANEALENHSNCHFQQNFENLGRTATRKALAETAKYHWLLFMDADVLPKNQDFVKKFDLKNQTADLVFGGITYETKKPEKEKILRWKYGKAREAKPVSERKKNPYLTIISGCFLIKKSVFLNTNDFHENVYGVDVLFCKNLEKLQVQVAHINNPIVHLGMESNVSFIEKTKKGLESLYQFEKENKIPNDYRPIQKAYQTLHKNGALKLFMKIMKIFEKSLLKNLKSSKPSLFLFDLFRLNYFSSLQSKL